MRAVAEGQPRPRRGAKRPRSHGESKTEGCAKVCLLLAALRWVDHQAEDAPLVHGDVFDNIENIYRDLRGVRSVRCCGEWDGRRQTGQRLSLLASSLCCGCGCELCSICAESVCGFSFLPARTNNNTSIPVQRNCICTTRLHAHCTTCHHLTAMFTTACLAANPSPLDA